ncbi:ATP-binding cassette domain-containing protein [Serratia marcescens]|uniref:ATP-binding cassette domain-containing protein n=1 Tax=Serratia marcescens TaxID=615 RepID=UPI000F7D76D3|nr:ATP-binding cassette domain-containing protein [Serratia marcescens]RTG00652.1 ATP-binding cassette domain-containing protein [Serratia marcescens]
MSDAILRVEHLMMHFGGIKALNDVNLEVERGSITALIGPNGAGKTTVFNCLTGFYRASGGAILLNTHKRPTDVIQVLGQKFRAGDWIRPKRLGSRLYYKMFGGTHLVNRAGLARTFQNIRLFREMSVVENLLVAQHQHLKSGVFAGLLKTPAFRRAEAEALARAAEWLERVGLLSMANRSAGNLAYGQQRRLEIARCMVTRPELLMLDEPAAGLNPKETDELDHLIVELRDRHKVSVLLIEHDMKLVMGISDRIYVVNQGTPLAQGTPAEIRNNPDVIRAYLGEE